VRRAGIVSLDGQRVGTIEETDTGTRFTYDPEWVERRDAVPVSLAMPIRAEPYESKGLLPFFENLLPEGWLLEIATSKLKIPKDDAFGLLLATCADCVGAVEVRPA
jgi:serine/threonine-protein kinase HipA